MPGRRRNNNRRRRVPPRRFVNSAFNGRQNFSRSADPRSTVSVPWNSITLMTQISGVTSSQTITPSNVASFLVQQGAHPTGSDVEIRILSASVYNLSGGPVVSQFYDLDDVARPTTAAVQPLSVLRDFPGRNRWAHISYQWPRSHQNIVMDTSSTNTIFEFTSGLTTATDFVIKISVLWRHAQTNLRAFVTIQASSLSAGPSGSDSTTH